jgi:uncharacterized protein
MNPRRASALLSLLVVATACQKHSEPQLRDPAAPVGSGTASGSGAPPAADPWASKAVKKDPLPHVLLWSIEKDGKTSYALGTIHTGVDPETRLPQLVWDNLDAKNTFAMETDLTETSALGDLMTRKDGKTIHAEIGDAYWKKLEGALTPRVAESIDHATAALPATLLSQIGLPETAPMDMGLLAHAQNNHKKIVYLEPVQKQVQLFLKWMDARALEEMLDDLDGQEQREKDLLAAYIAGDGDKMVQLSDADRADWKKSGRSDAEYDKMMDEMLYQRNASWIDEIEQMHAQGGGFIAVGAMHLLGKGSVLELLGRRGYKITRIGA